MLGRYQGKRFPEIGEDPALDEAGEQYGQAEDWFLEHEIPLHTLAYDPAKGTCHLPPNWCMALTGTLSATREEIEKHVQAYSYWYKRYDALESGELPRPSGRSKAFAKARADKRWLAEDVWLWEHGICAETELVFDPDTCTHSLPPNWQPSQTRELVP